MISTGAPRLSRFSARSSADLSSVPQVMVAATLCQSPPSTDHFPFLCERDGDRLVDEGFPQELLDLVWRDEHRAEPRRFSAGPGSGGEHLGQGRDVALARRVGGDGGLGLPQLFTHVPGQVSWAGTSRPSAGSW